MEADDVALDREMRTWTARGITPLCMGPQEKRFWSGYDDRALFKKVGLLHWYHHYYTRWSDESHAQPSALMRGSEVFDRLGAFEIGPQRRDAWFLLFATSRFGIEAIGQVNRMYRLGQRDNVGQLWTEAQRRFALVVPRA